MLSTVITEMRKHLFETLLSYLLIYLLIERVCWEFQIEGVDVLSTLTTM
jgi:hypothetical protein